MDNKQATLELGTKPVGKLLIQYALPAIVAMTAASLYNIVDSIFIGQGVGPFAISGLAITFPFMNLSSAFGAAVGVGSGGSVSGAWQRAAGAAEQRRGQHDARRACNGRGWLLMGSQALLKALGAGAQPGAAGQNPGHSPLLTGAMVGCPRAGGE